MPRLPVLWLCGSTAICLAACTEHVRGAQRGLGEGGGAYLPVRQPSMKKVGSGVLGGAVLEQYGANEEDIVPCF